MTLLRRHRLGAETVGLTVAIAATHVATAGLYLLVARSGPPSEFGRVVAVVGVALALAAVADFGGNALAVRNLAAGTMSASGFAARFTTRSGSFIALAVVGGLLAAAWGSALTTNVFVVLLLAALTATAQFATAPLRATSRIPRLAVALLTEKGLALLVGLLLAATGRLTPAHLWTCLAVGSGGAILTAAALWEEGQRRAVLAAVRNRPCSLREPWRGTLHFGTSTSVVGLQALDTTLVAAAAGTGAAGVYAAVSRWTSPLGLLASSYAQAALPHIARAPDHATAIRRLTRGWPVVLVTAVGVGVVAAAAPLLVSALLGPDYAVATAVLQVLVLGLLPMAVNQPLFAFLQARGRERWASAGLLVVIPIQLGAVYGLASAGGARAAALALLLAQSGLLAVFLAMVQRDGAVLEGARR